MRVRTHRVPALCATPQSLASMIGHKSVCLAVVLVAAAAGAAMARPVAVSATAHRALLAWPLKVPDPFSECHLKAMGTVGWRQGGASGRSGPGALQLLPETVGDPGAAWTAHALQQQLPARWLTRPRAAALLPLLQRRLLT